MLFTLCFLFEEHVSGLILIHTAYSQVFSGKLVIIERECLRREGTGATLGMLCLSDAKGGLKVLYSSQGLTHSSSDLS